MLNVVRKSSTVFFLSDSRYPSVSVRIEIREPIAPECGASAYIFTSGHSAPEIIETYNRDDLMRYAMRCARGSFYWMAC